MKINKLLLTLVLGSVLFASCDNDDTDLPRGDYDRGVLISGEGSGASTGSISFVSNDFSTTENLIYKKVNNTELGTFLQSIAFNESRAFIIVDNQNTITVVDRFTFKEQGKITSDLVVPRYMTIVGNKGYVTNWGSASTGGDDFVAVVNLESFSVESMISVGNGPEKIISNNGKLYVSHKGAFTTNNVISVIDITSKSVQEITVKDNPDELFFNSSGDLVVLSEGRVLYNSNWEVIGSTLGSISTINVNTMSVSSELIFAEGERPSLMVFNNNTIYYTLGSKVYSISENAATLASSSILDVEGFLYGMEVDDNRIYLINASFTDLSKLDIYNKSNKNKLITIDVALGASKIYFN